jgi:PAS domain-containing protein
VRWFAAYVALLVVSVFLQPLVRLSPALPSWLVTVLFVLNIGTPATIIFSLLHYYVARLEHVNEEMARLASFPELDPAAIIESDLTGCVYYFNAAAARLFPDCCQAAFETPLLADLDVMVPRLQAEASRSQLRQIKVGDRWYQQVLQLVSNGSRIRSFIIDITEGKRVEEALQLQNGYLAALHATTLELIGRLDINELLQSILNRAGELLGTGHGFVFLLEPGQQEMKARAGVGIFASRIGDRLRRDAGGVAPTVWVSGQPLLVTDYPAWAPPFLSAEARDIRSMASVPLRSGEAVVGVIGLAYDQACGKVFTDVEMEMLNRFAELASRALDNARLFAEANDYTRRLALLLEQVGKSQDLATAPALLARLGPAFDEMRAALIALRKAGRSATDPTAAGARVE